MSLWEFQSAVVSSKLKTFADHHKHYEHFLLDWSRFAFNFMVNPFYPEKQEVG